MRESKRQKGGVEKKRSSPGDGYVSWTCSFTPAASVTECGKDLLGGSMSRCFGEEGDDNRENADRVKCDGYTVEESEVPDTKGVDESSEYEKTGTYTDFFRHGDFETVQRSQSRYEGRTTVNDSCTDGRLTQEIEVSSSVGGEGRVRRSSDKCCPTISKI